MLAEYRGMGEQLSQKLDYLVSLKYGVEPDVKGDKGLLVFSEQIDNDLAHNHIKIDEKQDFDIGAVEVELKDTHVLSENAKSVKIDSEYIISNPLEGEQSTEGWQEQGVIELEIEKEPIRF